MTTGNKMLRFMIPAALALSVLLATGCDLLTNSDDKSSPADPNTLVLPAGTVQDWDSGDHDGEWFITYRGVGYANDESFGRIMLSNANYPGQTVTLSEFEVKLVSSENRGAPSGAFLNITGTTITLEPVVQMMRITGLWGPDTGNIARMTADFDKYVEWWYVAADTMVNGSFSYFNLGSPDATATNVQLQAGWNTMIFTVDGGNYTVTTGSEPTGTGWYID